MIEWKTEGTKIYQQLAVDMQNEWRACEPLTEAGESNEAIDKVNYKTWTESKTNT